MLFRSLFLIKFLLTALSSRKIFLTPQLVSELDDDMIIFGKQINISFELQDEWFPLDINQFNNIINIEQQHLEEGRMVCSMGKILMTIDQPILMNDQIFRFASRLAALLVG